MSISSNQKGLLYGCEIELEGSIPPQNIPSDSNPIWKVKGEDSLRSGYEYIFRNPLKIGESIEALDVFEKTMKKHHPVGSIRCSTHIHVNVLDLNIRQVYTIACLFHLLESLLFDKVPETRHGNLFCLRMRDAEAIFHNLKDSLDSGDYFQFPANQHKYSALNLATVWGLGTVEFRFLPAMWKKDELLPWFNIFGAIRNFGSKNSLADILQMYEDLPVHQFLGHIFEPPEVAFLIEGKTPLKINQLLHTNYDYIYEISRAFSRKRYRTHPKHWNPDLGNAGLGIPSASVDEWAEALTAVAATPFPNLSPPEVEWPDYDSSEEY